MNLPKTKSPYVDPKLTTIVNDYLEDMRDNRVDVRRFYYLDSIIVVQNNQQICDDDYAIGCCNGKIIKIKTDSSFSKDALAIYYKTLFYHEAGHCILRMDHHNNLPSIMNSVQNPRVWEYEENWIYFHKEYLMYYQYLSENKKEKIRF